MSHDNHRDSSSGNILHNHVFSLRIQSRCGLVEYDDAWILRETTRDFYSLHLATREVFPTFENEVVISTALALYLIVYFCVCSRTRYVLLIDRCVPQGDIVANRVLEKSYILVYQGKRIGKQKPRNLLSGLSVEQDFPGPRAIQSADEFR